MMRAAKGRFFFSGFQKKAKGLFTQLYTNHYDPYLQGKGYIKF